MQARPRRRWRRLCRARTQIRGQYTPTAIMRDMGMGMDGVGHTDRSFRDSQRYDAHVRSLARSDLVSIRCYRAYICTLLIFCRSDWVQRCGGAAVQPGVEGEEERDAVALSR